jgi:hypothetical protein
MSSPMLPDDRDNPYAPPKAEVGWHLARDDGGVMVPFTVEAILSHSWSVFRERMGLCLGAFWGSTGITYAILTVLVSIVGAASGARNPAAINLVFQLIFFLFLVFLPLWLSIGLTIVMLKLARRQEATFGDLFSGGRFILTMLGAGALACLAVWAVVIVAMIPVGLAALAFRQDSRAAPILAILAVVCGVGASLVLGTRLVPLAYVIVDRDPGVLGAFGQTVRLTAGREWRIIALVLLASAIYLGGFLACGVGVIFTLPFVVLMLAVMYVAMAGEKAAPVAGPDPDFDGLA